MIYPMALGWPGPLEMVILAGLGLLIFGKRLPEVGRSVGKTIVEFKKGMREVEEELKNPDTTPTPTQSLPTQAPNALPQGHKFDPYTGKPIVQEAETTTTR